jgi:hypothetical protein
MKNSQNIKKLVSMNIVLYERINKKANNIGVSFQDYLKHLLIIDAENPYSIEYASPELAKRIKASLDDYKNGNFVEFDPFDENQLRNALPE